ncbi:MAG: hypothetical protein WDZ29_01275 [Balneolaceae bacterium]
MADTLFYVVHAGMIDNVWATEDEDRERYSIEIRLRNRFHGDLEEKTQMYPEGYLAIVYSGDVISPDLQKIEHPIQDGRISIRWFSSKLEVRKLKRRIVSE